MKLLRSDFVNISKKGDLFHYEYVFFGKSFLKKHYYMTKVKSPSPWFTWKEIQKIILHHGLYFEDILERGTVDLPIVGKLSVTQFSEADTRKYGTDASSWQKNFSDKAIKDSFEFRKEYGDRSEEEKDLIYGVC